jgi:EAL domain-containing protein (putative c-di-GMP-specific phosphodiesterase class I)
MRSDMTQANGANLLQPVFSVAHRRAVGYEALGTPQVASFTAQAGTGWLFLRVDPRAGSAAAFLESCQLPPQRLVAQIAAPHNAEDAVLAAVEACRGLGCLVALDDFGAVDTSFGLVWRAKPDFVKLDRRLVAAALEEPGARRKLTGIVSLLHDSGALVCAGRVERREEAVIAVGTGTDFVQGRYFGAPEARIGQTAVGAGVFDALAAEAGRRAAAERARAQALIEPYLSGMRVAAALLACGAQFEEAALQVLGLHAAERCFLLDGEGHQMGRNLVSLRNSGATDARFAPLMDVNGAAWETREYFRRAIAQPDRVQVTRPYLSLTGPQNCITLSVAVRTVGGTKVLCADVSADALAAAAARTPALESAHAGSA